MFVFTHDLMNLWDGAWIKVSPAESRSSLEQVWSRSGSGLDQVWSRSGTGLRMGRTLLWLLVSVWSSSVADGAALKVMSAPSLLRVGTSEYIFVECQDCGSASPMNVEISAWNFPTKHIKLASASVALNSGNRYQALAELLISPDVFMTDTALKQYVYLRARFPEHTLEKVVLVSFQLGYIFIQTDKTLYAPDSTVNLRVFGLTPGMKPIERKSPGDHMTVLIEIMNPEGIVEYQNTVLLRSGLYQGNYNLNQFSSSGKWKITARFERNPQQTYSAQFEVKRYVLPRFEVKLTAESSFFFVDTESFSVKINAKYLFGKEVDSVVHVLFGVIKDGNKKTFPASQQRIPLRAGAGEATLKKDHILKTFLNPGDLVGGSLFVSARLFTAKESEMAELRDIPIVSSPYAISFKKTHKYFKPGLPFDVLVSVVNPDGRPAGGVPVVVDPGNVMGVTGADGGAHLSINTQSSFLSLSVSARTSDPTLPANRQASETMLATPHHSTGRNYIQISVNKADVELGKHLKVNLLMNIQPNQVYDITFLVLSRGQLVHHGRQSSAGQALVAFNIPVTKKMLPSFRIVAYYHPNSNEVVSDSVWLDVEDACAGTLKLAPKNPAASYKPWRVFDLRVTGDPGATVGLVAVDKGVYVLNDKLRLTQKKVWEIVEEADPGCTPGGGSNSMGVFSDAGLLFQTDTASGTSVRQELKCPSSARKKRDSFVSDVTSSWNDEDEYIDSSEILSRTRFSESSQWITSEIPPCSSNSNCDTNIKDLRFPFPDSITTLEFTAISLSEKNGICVGQPLEVVLFKPFFIDLQFPYSAVIGQKTEIRAILHNYLNDPITVRVELVEQKDVCSAASKYGKYLQKVEIGALKTNSVPFTIVPIKEGVFNIEVKASVNNSFHADAVIKSLRVEPNGVLTKVIKIVELDPKGGVQEQTVTNVIPATEIVPKTSSIAKVFVKGVRGAQDQDYNLEVELRQPGISRPYLFRFSVDNYNTTRYSGYFKINENVNVIARGTGKATLTLVTQYYAVPRDSVSDCKRFNLSVDFTREKAEDEGDIYRLKMEFFFKNELEDASLAVIDISLPTGFIVMTEDLDSLSEGRGRSLARYELNQDVSGDSLILFLDKVSHSRVQELAFRMRQIQKVGDSKPAAVSIYEYYNNEKCIRYYKPKGKDAGVMTLCKGNECRCTGENCSAQKGGHIQQNERMAELCEFGRTDFVYKVTVENIAYNPSFDTYTMRIENVIKEGNDKSAEGNLRKFHGLSRCRNNLNLQVNKGYLVMGEDEDTIPDPASQSFEYLILERTWIEYWPRAEECQSPEHRPTCLDLDALVDQFAAFGCHNK